jgi:hypothetical protein
MNLVKSNIKRPYILPFVFLMVQSAFSQYSSFDVNLDARSLALGGSAQVYSNGFGVNLTIKLISNYPFLLSSDFTVIPTKLISKNHGENTFVLSFNFTWLN